MSGLNGWFVETIRLLFRFSSRLCPARHDLQSRTALFKRRRTDFLDALSVTTPVCGVATPPDQGPELKRRSKFDVCFFCLFFSYTTVQYSEAGAVVVNRIPVRSDASSERHVRNVPYPCPPPIPATPILVPSRPFLDDKMDEMMRRAVRRISSRTSPVSRIAARPIADGGRRLFETPRRALISRAASVPQS